MASGLEIYTDNNVLQLGKEYYAAFLSESRTATQVNSGSVGSWQGFFKILQTSGATIEQSQLNNDTFPELSNYSSDTKWFKLLWRDLTGDLTPANSGIEIYDSDGNIEYNSNYNPLKIIDVVEGRYNHPSGAAGINSGLYTVFKKQYNKPVMVLIDRRYYVSDRLRIIASTSGKFELYFDFNNRSSYGGINFNYKFIIFDATGAI